MQTVAVLPRGPFSKGRKKAIERTLSGVEVLDNAAVLPESEEVEYGRFVAGSSVLVGGKVGGSRLTYVSGYSSGWLFNTSRKFFPRKSGVSAELELEPATYRMEIDTPGSGLLELPGYRLKNGVLLLYTTPGYRFVMPKESMTLETKDGYVQLSLKLLEKGMEGRVEQYPDKKRYVSVVLRGKSVGDILFYQEESGRFGYEFLKEPTLIVSHEKVLSPQALQRAMNGFIGLSGHGEFTLILEAGKAREEMEFTVEPTWE